MDAAALLATLPGLAYSITKDREFYLDVSRMRFDDARGGVKAQVWAAGVSDMAALEARRDRSTPMKPYGWSAAWPRLSTKPQNWNDC